METMDAPGAGGLLPRSPADLWDLAEDVGRLLERSDELDLTPACCDVLLSLDDAITLAVRGSRRRPGGRTLL
jgi:hypothetical protein